MKNKFVKELIVRAISGAAVAIVLYKGGNYIQKDGKRYPIRTRTKASQ